MSQPHSRYAAFTILELAVVLSIIGLLVGAVISGQSLLRQSALQAIVSDYSKYSAAVAQFNQQYGGLPGDLLDATNYWGDDNTNCPDAAVTNGSPGTCNGNGNANMADSAEPYRAWQQLVLADLITGDFTGIASGGGAVPGTNSPTSRIRSAGWSFGFKAATSANANDYDQDLLNFLAIGGAVAGGLTQAAAISPQDAWKIDRKLDDGRPATGRVITRKPAALANCADSATDASANYNSTRADIACSLNMSLTLR